MLFKINEILDAPCVFCGYNGPGYWQPHTHDKSCPFYEIGGDRERENALVVFARKGMLTYNNAIHSDGNIGGILDECPVCGMFNGKHKTHCQFRRR